jgi:hypothetical protein
MKKKAEYTREINKFILRRRQKPVRSAVAAASRFSADGRAL